MESHVKRNYNYLTGAIMFRRSSLFVSLVLLFSLVSCGGKDSSGSNEEAGSSRSYKVISVSLTTTNGNLGSSNSIAIANADALCDDVGEGFKALLGNSVRRPPSTDWVLLPNTEYRRDDGTTVVGITNDSGVFDFELTNSISDDFYARVWTGFTTAFDNHSNNCSEWTEGSNARSGRIGIAAEIDTHAFSGWNIGCADRLLIYCVEQ